ncbi:uncharacterized protein LOC6733443 isoform X1 [Drosophila simulans]|uniref:Uncharacterized protein, isoform A n=1 Tax=Drosophila simulans TaxID=7240 RepID=A0A0J9R8U3_DROSI|nr:uncharacterized protein LOC6733443 isoform X1 [Drosophila simulans]KMY92114.1 uncharacterized protein Dsimw501_GD10214, isoform A [Drosophila simulans]
MSCRCFCLVAAALLLLLFHQQSCDAATQAPQKTVVIAEQSAPAAEVEAKKPVVKKSQAENPPAGPKDSMVVVDDGGPAPVAPGAPVARRPGDVKAPEVLQPPGRLPVDDVHVERSPMSPDVDFPGQAVVYILVGITSTAILLLIMRVYRLRLSRAERKYGVQGDRANQELTPLPMAIEDVNSDEEDHTLFEVNRQNIRIL